MWSLSKTFWYKVFINIFTIEIRNISNVWPTKHRLVNCACLGSSCRTYLSCARPLGCQGNRSFAALDLILQTRLLCCWLIAEETKRKTWTKENPVGFELMLHGWLSYHLPQLQEISQLCLMAGVLFSDVSGQTTHEKKNHTNKTLKNLIITKKL